MSRVYAGETIDQQSKRNYTEIKAANSSAYVGTVTILGDPELQILQNIRLLVFMDDSNLHYVSGIYWIQSITHTIEGGTFYSTLKICHNACTAVTEHELSSTRRVLRSMRD